MRNATTETRTEDWPGLAGHPELLKIPQVVAARFASMPDEDLVMLGTLEMLKAWRRYDPGRGGSLVGYLFEVVKRAIRHIQYDRDVDWKGNPRVREVAREWVGHIDRDAYLGDLVDDWIHYEPPSEDAVPSAEAEYLEQTLHEAVEREVWRLAPRQREAIFLHFYEDMSFVEVGRSMGIAPQRAGRHVQAGVRNLRRALSAYED